MDRPQQRALLIGIDRYVYPTSLASRPVGDLQGATNDILAVEEYLVSKRNVAPENITRLLAPVPGTTLCYQLPPSHTYRHPTYKNIVGAFESLAADSQAGDMVYVHYSGHGGRGDTVFPTLKKPKEEDHSIIPCDYTEGGPLLRDVEIGALIQDIVAKEAVLTVVFDCCHSGGALRGEEDERKPLVRGFPRLHRSDPVKDLPGEAMMQRIHSHAECSIWMKNPTGFAFLAACSPTQTAAEMRDGPHHYGLLTYHLLHALNQVLWPSPRDPGSETILQLIKSKISGHDQTPSLIGDRPRFFFGSGVRGLLSRIFVKQRSKAAQGGAPDEVIINAGAAHLVRWGSEYSILSLAGSGEDGEEPQKPEVLARVEIDQVNDFESSASGPPSRAMPHGAKAFPRWDEVHPGCPVVLTSMPREHKFTVQFDSELRTEEAAELATKTWIRQWEMDEDAGDAPSFTVTVDSGRVYAIRQGDLAALPQVLSTMAPLSAAQPRHFTTLLNRLEHLAKFCTMGSLQTPPESDLALTLPMFSLDVVPAPGPQKVREGGRLRTLFPITTIQRHAIDDAYPIKQDTLFSLKLTNRTDRELGFVVLNFTPEFGVHCIFPCEDNEAFATVAARDTWIEDFYVKMPGSLEKAAAEGVKIIETFKVIVCSPPQSFDPLRLPKLWEAEERSFRGGPEEEDDASRAMCVKSMQRGMLSPQDESGWQVIDVPIRIMP